MTKAKSKTRPILAKEEEASAANASVLPIEKATPINRRVKREFILQKREQKREGKQGKRNDAKCDRLAES